MKLSLGSQFDEELTDVNGYGYATNRMIASLKRLGYDIETNRKGADVEIWFDQPHHWKWTEGAYRIGYHPWESTQLRDKYKWKESMNMCDEIWTPSPLIAEWYKKYMDIKVPVYVYEHGVDPVWEPHKRIVKDKFRFLHIGGEAARKGVLDSMRALRKAFPNNSDVELNLKMIARGGWNVGTLRRINVIDEVMELPELIRLYHDNHVFVYPSYGEGFGLTPLQAMATGMPTITVPGWAPYKKYIDPNLSVGSHLVKSPWPALHPGNMLKPSESDIIEAMRYAYNNYDEVQQRAHAQLSDLMTYYDWDRLTLEVFSALESRL